MEELIDTHDALLKACVKLSAHSDVVTDRNVALEKELANALEQLKSERGSNEQLSRELKEGSLSSVRESSASLGATVSAGTLARLQGELEATQLKVISMGTTIARLNRQLEIKEADTAALHNHIRCLANK